MPHHNNSRADASHIDMVVLRCLYFTKPHTLMQLCERLIGKVDRRSIRTSLERMSDTKGDGRIRFIRAKEGEGGWYLTRKGLELVMAEVEQAKTG